MPGPPRRWLNPCDLSDQNSSPRRYLPGMATDIILLFLLSLIIHLGKSKEKGNGESIVTVCGNTCKFLSISQNRLLWRSTKNSWWSGMTMSSPTYRLTRFAKRRRLQMPSSSCSTYQALWQCEWIALEHSPLILPHLASVPHQLIESRGFHSLSLTIWVPFFLRKKTDVTC